MNINDIYQVSTEYQIKTHLENILMSISRVCYIQESSSLVNFIPVVINLLKHNTVNTQGPSSTAAGVNRFQTSAVDSIPIREQQRCSAAQQGDYDLDVECLFLCCSFCSHYS